MAAGARAPKEIHRCACGVAVTIVTAFSLPISAQSPAAVSITPPTIGTTVISTVTVVATKAVGSATSAKATLTAVATGTASATFLGTDTVSNADNPVSQTLLTTQTPAYQDISNNRPFELGMRVLSDVAGQITALRFWKGAGESGTHTGHVWSAAGELLATVTFTDENPSGWQQQALVPPIAMAANTEYVVSVTTPTNNLFVVTQNAFATPFVNGHLRAPAGSNGVYGTIGTFPTSSYDSSNYFRDLVFVPGGGGGNYTIPPSVSITAPATLSTVSGTVTVAANATGNGVVAGVQFQLDGAPLGAEDTTAPFAVAWNTTAQPGGLHTLTAVARDTAGNRTTSASVPVMVANSTGQVTLAWDASADPTVTGYKVHIGTTSRVYTVGVVDAGNVTSCTIAGLQAGTVYYIAVTAYDQNGNESGFSDEVSATIR